MSFEAIPHDMLADRLVDFGSRADRIVVVTSTIETGQGVLAEVWRRLAGSRLGRDGQALTLPAPEVRLVTPRSDYRAFGAHPAAVLFAAEVHDEALERRLRADLSKRRIRPAASTREEA